MSSCTNGVAVAVSNHRRRTQRGEILPQHAVIRTEIVSPLRDAVCLVNGNQVRLPLGQHLEEPGNAQPLRGDEQKLQVAVEVVHASLARSGAVAPGMDALNGEASFFELGGLIFHQGNQRADYERSSTEGDARQLVAERFAGPG